MAGQCLRSNQHEFDTTPGGSGGQEGLVCSGPWGHEESETTKRLNDVDNVLWMGMDRRGDESNVVKVIWKGEDRKFMWVKLV